MTRRARVLPLLAALTLLFFFSGACALIYQVLWLRMLGWVFGVTAYAASTVWAMFMTGLAVGGVLAGRIGDRVRKPFAWFGAAELLIGVTAFATPLALSTLERVYISVLPHVPASSAALVGARVVIAFLVLIVPTTLMGATLPLVLKTSAFRESSLGTQVGILYGSNALGAIAGTLTAGLYLIPAHGIHRTFVIAATLNVLVGLSAMALSWLPDTIPAEAGSRIAADDTAATAAPSRFAATPVQLRMLLVVFTLSGTIGLALEVVWFRVLSLFLRPTVYGFAVMLATVLGGIAIGSYAVAPLLRRIRSVLPVALLEMCVGVAVVLSFAPLRYLPLFTERLTPLLSGWMPPYLVYPIAASVLVIFPSALLAGLAFPIGLHLWTAGATTGHTAERVGRFYSLNVCGAIAGSLLGGFVLLPALGSRTSVIVLGLASFGSGLALLAVSRASRLTRLAAALAGTTAVTLAVLRSPNPIDQFNMQRYPAMDPIFVEEGVESTVAVHEFGPPTARRRLMSMNGAHQAGSDGPTTFLHRRIGHLPMIVHPNAWDTLVIGLGGGATAGAAALHDGSRVDVIELSDSVVHGAAFFDSINYGAVHRPNLHIRLDDGRNFMMLTTQRYDVITADLIQPIYAGAGNLYSKEYFELMRRTLKPGGMVMQWIPGTDAEFKAIARTFISVFPETTAWADGSLFIGSLEPLVLRRSDFEWKRQLPGRAQGMKDAGIETFEDLLHAYKAGPDEIRAFVGDGPMLTDDRPLAEYFLSLPRDKEVNLGALRGDVSRHVRDEPGTGVSRTGR